MILENSSPVPFESMVAIGAIPGWSIFRQFGENPDIGSGTEQIWPLGVIQVLPSAAGVASFSSSSAADTSAGTGAQSICINGLADGYVSATEIIATNGTGTVTTTTEFLRINEAYAINVGSGGVNAGNITISIGGNPQCYIGAASGQSQVSQYTCPSGHSLLLRLLDSTTGRISGNVDLAAKWQFRTGPGKSWRSVVDLYPYQGQVNIEGYYFLPEKVDIRGIVTSTGTGLNCHIEYSGFIINNDYI